MALGAWVAAGALALLVLAWAVGRRPGASGEEEVRRLLELERTLGPAHPEVRRLRARVRPWLLGEPDPIPWGRYRWHRAVPGSAYGVDGEESEA